MNPAPDSIIVSVIIVSWNARDYLVQCLESLATPVCKYPMEIIVVDNASTDGSPECVASRFPQVRLIRNAANLGFAKANNIGIAQSRGEYLCLINSDVKVLDDCITQLVDYCRSQPAVGMVGPHILGRDGQWQHSCRGFPGVWNMFCRALALDMLFPRVKWFTGYALSHWSSSQPAPVDILSGCFWLIRREAVAQVGVLDEAFFIYGEDMDWCRRFWAGGWKLVYFPAAKAIHYGGASSANAPLRFYLEMQRADLQYWKKHHSWPAVAAYVLISTLHQSLRAVGFTLAWALRKSPAYRHKIQCSLASLQFLIFGHFPAQMKTAPAPECARPGRCDEPTTGSVGTVPTPLGVETGSARDGRTPRQPVA